ncbi:MAG: UDP-N-acetyl glucosamine 2-epimerase, partial [FCB group bacterium]|nr:UDP-N-acetyl glucosamine 2-epimerase [FCB group bacterium]
GTNRLIGTTYDNIPEEVKRALANPVRKNSIPELWDGKAAERIADVVREWFSGEK